MISRRKLIRIAAPAIIGIAAVPKLARAMQIPIAGWDNPFSFPASLAPGFNPNHVAASGINTTLGFSVVATPNAGMFNVLNGKPLTASAVPPLSGLGSSGPYAYFTAPNNKLFSISQPTVTPSAVTMAAITMWPAVPAASQVLVFVGGNMLLYANSGPITLYNGANISSGFTPAANIPYFLAVSAVNISGGGPVIFAITNLITGATTIVSTSTASNAQALTANAAIGNSYNVQTDESLSYIFAAMFSTAFNSAAVLQSWATRPWDFWYPPNILMSELKGQAAAAPTSHFLPLLGVGR